MQPFFNAGPAVHHAPLLGLGDGRNLNPGTPQYTTLRPGMETGAHNVRLNGRDGLDHATPINCAMMDRLKRDRITMHYGTVSYQNPEQTGRILTQSR